MKKWFPLLIVCLGVKAASYANYGCPNYGIPYPAVCGSCNNVYGFGEFLYWKAHEDGLAWAASQTDNFEFFVAPTTAEPRWKWDPGFRVGVGYLFDCVGWDLSLAYTWYNSDAVDSRAFNDETAVAFGLFDANSSGSAGGHAAWDLNFQTLELALKQPFFIGKRVILNPSLSVLGAYTSEKYNIDNILPGTPPLASSHVHHKQRLNCIGPKLGLDSIWQFNDYLSLFGEGSIACLWTHYHVNRLDINEDGEGVFSVNANLQNKFDTIRLVPAYTIGLKWNQPICNGNYRLDVKVAWEQQVWLQHNQFYLLNVRNDNTLLFNNTNLSLYGLTASIGLQF